MPKQKKEPTSEVKVSRRGRPPKDKSQQVVADVNFSNKPLPKSAKVVNPAKAAGDTALATLASHGPHGKSEFLISNVHKVEKLEEQRRLINREINSVYATIKQNGFPVGAARKIVALRRMDPEERIALEEDMAMVSQGLGETRQMTLFGFHSLEAPTISGTAIVVAPSDAPTPVEGEAPLEEAVAKLEEEINLDDPEAVALSRMGIMSQFDHSFIN